MSPPAPGYSGKPLYQKLGLKPGMTCLALGAPVDYPSLVPGAKGVAYLAGTGPADIVHLFCPDRATLEHTGPPALAEVANGGMLWISWPKKSSELFVDLTEDHLRTVMLPTGWVDVKVCAVTEDWSGLKFLRRKR